MIQRTYTVLGMACGSCATFISEELQHLPGVTAVSVDIARDTVTLTSAHEVEAADVRSAVERAGYELTPPPAS